MADEFPGRFAPTFAGALPPRPADKPCEFIVRTGVCEAAAAGAVRATTERFATDEGGVATRPWAFAAPVKLALFGVNEAPLLTCAPQRRFGNTHRTSLDRLPIHKLAARRGRNHAHVMH